MSRTFIVEIHDSENIVDIQDLLSKHDVVVQKVVEVQDAWENCNAEFVFDTKGSW